MLRLVIKLRKCPLCSDYKILNLVEVSLSDCLSLKHLRCSFPFSTVKLLSMYQPSIIKGAYDNMKNMTGVLHSKSPFYRLIHFNDCKLLSSQNHVAPSLELYSFQLSFVCKQYRINTLLSIL